MTPTLFDDQDSGPKVEESREHAPLADRMRPRTLDEVVGQENLVGPEGFLRRAVAEDRVPSAIFWGPPGSGKTTLAEIIARVTSSRYVPFSAVTSGIREVKGVMAEAQRLRRGSGVRTILFVDEIHRFNRAQQDAFLPYVEHGEIALIGATTENPSFQVNSALLSRCRVLVLNPLTEQELLVVLRRALTSERGGLGNIDVEVEGEALEAMARLAVGDARRALNLLEQTVADAISREDSGVTAEVVHRVAQRKVLLYDRAGEEHFNLISALHKSLRESDPDASLYWFTRMLEAGEDPNYLARRMLRFAVEDVGLADPDAMVRAIAAWETYERLGSPEGELALAEVTIYLALAPKSNAVYRAYGRVRRAVADRPAAPVPPALRNAPTRLMKDLGYGEGYEYAHDVAGGVAGLRCLPEEVGDGGYYEPTDRGFEGELRQRIERFAALRQEARRRTEDRS